MPAGELPKCQNCGSPMNVHGRLCVDCQLGKVKVVTR